MTNDLLPTLQSKSFYSRRKIDSLIHRITSVAISEPDSTVESIVRNGVSTIPHSLRKTIISGNSNEVSSILRRYQNTEHESTMTATTTLESIDEIQHWLFQSHKRAEHLTAALFIACSMGFHSIAEMLIQYGCDINGRDGHSRTPLHIAAMTNHTHCLSVLLKSNADVSVTDVDLWNALHFAVSHDSVPCVKALLHFRPDLVDQQDRKGMTPLMLASQLTNITILEQCLQHSKRINISDWNGNTALHHACNSALPLNVEYLLNKNASIHRFDYTGWDAFHFAARNGCIQALKALFSALDSSKSKPTTASEWQSSIPIYDHCDNEGWTPLHHAACFAHSETIQYLLHCGANPKLLDGHNCSPNAVSWWHGHPTIAQLLPTFNPSPKDSHTKVLNTMPFIGDAASIHDPDTKYFHLSISPDESSEDETSPKRSSLVSTPSSPSPNLFRKGTGLDATQCEIRFQVQCGTKPHEYVFLVGDCDRLGNWDISKAVPMYKFKASYEKRKEENKKLKNIVKKESDEDSIPTSKWVCSCVLNVGDRVQYKYIVQTYQALISFEVLLNTDRSITPMESCLIDDGVFGRRSAMRRIVSFASFKDKQQLSMQSSANSANLSPINSDSVNEAKQTKDKEWSRGGWLVNDAQLQIMLGHPTKPENTAPLIIDGNSYPIIHRIVIRSGAEDSRTVSFGKHYGVSFSVELPIDDPLMVWKFQANSKRIRSLCTLTFDFYPITGPPIARASIMPQQMLNNPMGSLTIPMQLIASHQNTFGHTILGEFNFEYTLIRPFIHPRCGAIVARSFSNSADVLIGHRGTGSWRSALMPGPRRTHIKENTILAFSTASTFGAHYVEFDVQLTKDKVPIIYHDFLFRTGVFRIPIDQITLSQLKQHNQSLDEKRALNRKMSVHTDDIDIKPGSKKLRSSLKTVGASSPNLRSLKSSVAIDTDTILGTLSDSVLSDDSVASDERPADDSAEGMAYLHDHYCTLAEALRLAPPSLGFNIEVKYPNYDECDEFQITPIDVNVFVDKVLEMVFNCAKERKIVFSSFHPTICSLLSLKQPQYPVLFLTTADRYYCDTRSLSLYEAIRFARRDHLLGIVSDVGPVSAAPHVIEAIHDAGLICLTYGDQNNDTTHVDVQRQWGIDGIICDHVQHVKSHLQSHPSPRLSPLRYT